MLFNQNSKIVIALFYRRHLSRQYALLCFSDENSHCFVHTDGYCHETSYCFVLATAVVMRILLCFTDGCCHDNSYCFFLAILVATRVTLVIAWFK